MGFLVSRRNWWPVCVQVAGEFGEGLVQEVGDEGGEDGFAFVREVGSVAAVVYDWSECFALGGAELVEQFDAGRVQVDERDVFLAGPLPGMSLCPNWMRTYSAPPARALAQCPSSIKLLEERPPRA